MITQSPLAPLAPPNWHLQVQAKSENHEEAVKLAAPPVLTAGWLARNSRNSRNSRAGKATSEVKESLVLAGELGDTREQALNSSEAAKHGKYGVTSSDIHWQESVNYLILLGIFVL